MEKKQFEIEMLILANLVTKTVMTGFRTGLDKRAACKAGLIGVLSIMRADRMDEESLWKEVCRAMPTRKTLGKQAAKRLGGNS